MLISDVKKCFKKFYYFDVSSLFIKNDKKTSNVDLREETELARLASGYR